MARMSFYAFMFGGLLLMFYVTGVVDTSGSFLNIIRNPQDFQKGDIVTQALALLATGGAIAAIIIGFVSKNIELAVMTGIIPIITGFMWDIMKVYTKLASYNALLATIIFSPFLFLFIFTLIDWWRGRDT